MGRSAARILPLLVSVCSVAAASAQPGEPYVAETFRIDVPAYNRLDHLSVRHPEEAYPAELIAGLRAAAAAEAFLWPSYPGEALEYGVCITGEELRQLVDSVLDPRSYSWGDAWACIQCAEEPTPPQLGVAFYAPDNTIVLVNAPRFMNMRFVEPWSISMYRLSAIFDPGIFTRVALRDFPDVDFEPVQSGFTGNNGYWDP